MDKTININGVIASSESEGWAMSGGEQFYTSEQFVADVAELSEGDNLTINVDTYGGSIDAGVKIYNVCKELQSNGVNVETFNKGKQHSIGNVIMLGGKKRKAYQSSIGVIHLPRVSSESFFAQFDYTADDLEAISADLRMEGERILDIYVTETGKDKEELRAVMNQERTLSAIELKELNFITEIVNGTAQPTTQNRMAFAYTNLKLNFKNKNMEKELEGVKKEVFSIKNLLTSFINKISPAVNMDFEGEDGKKLHVVREEGEMTVGDEATVDGQPDGTVVYDGNTIVVTAGKIESITPVEGGMDDLENLKAQNADLQAQIANLTEQNATLTTNLAEATETINSVMPAINKLETTITNYEVRGRQTPPKQTKTNLSAVDFSAIEAALNNRKNK